MAYISSTGSSGQTTTSTSFEATLPPQIDSGDYLVAFINIRAGTTGTLSSTGGWTQYNAGTSTPTVRLLVWRKVAGASETPPTFTWSGGAVTWSVVIHAIKDYDSTTPIHTFAHLSNATSTSSTIPSITPTINDCLLIYGLANNTQASLPTTNDIYWRAMGGTVGSTSVVTTGTFQQDTAATKASFTVPNIQSQVSQSTVIAIANSAGGSKDFNKTASVTRIRDMGNYDTGGFLTFAAPNAGVSGLTSINGINLTGNTSTVSASVITSATMFFYQYQWTFNVSSAGADVWEGAWNTLASATNLQNKIVSQSFALGGSQFSPIYGTIIVFADASNNWVAYELMARKNYVLTTQQVKHIAIGATTAYASGGTIDWTAVTKVGWFSARRSTTTGTQNLAVSRLIINDGLTLTHGGTNNRVSYAKIQEAIYNASANAGHSNLQGAGQFFNRASLQIGNGTNATFANLSGQAFEFPTSSDATWAGSSATNKFELRIKSSANDVLDFSSSLFNSSIQQNLIIDPTGTLPTTAPNFSGSVWIGWDVEANLANWEFNSVVFKNSKITLNGGLLTDCSLTGKAGVTTVTSNNPDNISGCSFTSGGTGHAIEFTASGSFGFAGNSFTGYGADGTTNAAIYNNSGGLLTLQLAAGDSVPTVRNGTGASTVINLPQAQASVTGIVSGSRVRIYNVTSAVEIDNLIVSGTSWTLSYDDGNEFTSGDIVEVTLAYNSGTTAKLPQKLTAIATVSGWSALASQADDTVYNTNAINGSTVTEFTADYPNVQIDANDVDGETTVQRIYAWFSYVQMASDGIKFFFNGLTADDAVNYQIHTSIVDLKLDNTNGTTPLMIIGGRLYRDDGTTVIDPASNSIQLDPNKAYSVNVGGSALTTAEHDALMNASSKSNLIPALL